MSDAENAASTILGHTTCHLCGYDHAPVKVMKTGRAYYTCPECDVQVFTRSRAGDKLLREKTRTTTTTKPAANEKPAQPRPAPAAAAPAAKRGLGLDGLD